MLWKNYIQIFSLWAVSSRKFRGLSLTSQDVGTVLAVSGVFCFSKFYANDNWIWEAQSNYYINSTPIYHLLLAFSLNYLADSNFIYFLGFGVLVYQLAIYPFLAKYFGPIKPFRPAAVCDKCIFVWFASVHSCKKNFESLKILYNMWGNKQVSIGQNESN